MNNDIEVRALLRESGFELEDFPEYLRSNSTLIEYARKFPPELRPQYLGDLLQCFRTYELLSVRERGRLLKFFESQLQEEHARKRWDH